jgi:hypothetical protein
MRFGVKLVTETNNPSFFRSLRFRYGAALAVFLAIAGFFLWQEHKAHIIGYGPVLLLLGLCLGMHLLMHGSHGGGNHDYHHDGKKGDQ